MIYLLLSMLCATSLVIILRLFETWKIKTEYGIVLNYLVCCITGLVSMENKSLLREIPSWNGWWICLLLGCSFMAIFILIGKTIKLLGVTTTSIAYKLSFIIPAIISIIFYKDVLTIYKMIGIVTAVFSVYFIAYVPGNKDNTQEQHANKKIWIYPVIIFIGAGIIDASFNYIQRNFTPPNFDHIVSIVTFSGAFISGMILF